MVPEKSVIEVVATHITVGERYPRLVCELYPRVFLVDGVPGPVSAQAYAHRIAPLEQDGDRVFPVEEFSAELAAEKYEDLVEQFAQRRELAMITDPEYAETLIWPPKGWKSRAGKH